MSEHEPRFEALKAALSGGERPLAPLAAQARAELASTPRARPWWQGAVAVVAVLIALACGAAYTMGTNEVQHEGSLMRWGPAAALLAVMAAGAVWALRPGGRGARLGLLAFGLAAAGLAVVSGSGANAELPFMAGLGCARVECLAAAAPIALVLGLLSGFAADTTRTLLGALAAGAAGVFALHLHCPIGSWSHLAAFHVLPWLAMVGVAVVARRFMRSRSCAP